MIILISPSKEMAIEPLLSDRRPILMNKVLELSQPDNLTEDQSYYQAIDLYNGLQFRYLRQDLSDEDLTFIDKNLIILSAQYGIVRPFDGIRRYRKDFSTRGLYKAWGDSIYQEITLKKKAILNLASQEFSKNLTRYATPSDRIINVHFYEQTVNGELKKHASISKKGRGQMVNYIARNRINKLEDIKAFNDLNYNFSQTQSTENNWIFIRQLDN